MRKAIVLCILLILVLPASGVAAEKDDDYNRMTPSMSVDVFKASKAAGLADVDADDLKSDAYGEIPFWVDMVNADSCGNTGEDVYVAVLDTGLLSNWETIFPNANIADDLGKGFSHDVAYDTGVGDIVWGDLDDDRGFLTNEYGSGHGSHVTSTIAGYNLLGYFDVRGVAPEVNIVPVLVLDTWWVEVPDGYSSEYYGVEEQGGHVLFRGGTDEMVAAGIIYAADLKEELDAPLVISMSLGGPTPTKMIENAINYAIKKGCIIVASAGNSGMTGMGWPGAYPDVISCGAAGWTKNWMPAFPWWRRDVPEDLNTKDGWGNNWQHYLEDFSSRPNKALGQKAQHLDVCDPGAAIVGPYKSNIYWSGSAWVNPSWGIYYLWGTSMSAPHVSAISAMVLEDDGDLNQGQMHAIVKKAASGCPLPADGSIVYDPWYGVYHFTWSGTDYGSGFLLADKALTKASNLYK
jgi:subtilisin family serine protease